MARAAKIYTYTIAANASVQLPVDGGYYKLLAASGSVRVSRDGNAGLELQPGQGERENFQRLTFEDLSGASNTIEVIVADNSFVDDRIYGNVQVIDGGRLITMANNSFGGYVSQNPSAGNYSHVQLWNPVGRTVQIAVSSVILSSYTTGGSMQLRWFATPLATLWANPNSKNFGSPNSGAELRQEANAAILGAGANLLVYCPSSTANKFDFKEPIVIRPGMGLLAVHGQVNSHITASFDFYEFTP